MVRTFYDQFTRMADHRLGADGITVMNYGFAELHGDGVRPAVEVPASLERERYGLQLYAFATRGVELEGKDVLEVGCGRGGGGAFLFEHGKPRSMTCLDLSRDAIAFCRSRHAAAGLSFQVGDAEALPFPANTFDVVVNIESSHNYNDCAAFYRGVRRVLRPGGTFVYADFFRAQSLPAVRGLLDREGMLVDSETLITPNIVAACEVDHERRAALIRKAVPFALRGFMKTFSATRGSAMLRALDRGAIEYVVLRARTRSVTSHQSPNARLHAYDVH